jgi:hypothetical protein
MNITEKRYIPQELYPFIKLLKIGSNQIKLLGSAGLASQRYYSDYDLLTPIDRKMSCERFYNSLRSVLEITENNPNMYFIEIKIQTSKRKVRELPDKGKFCKIYDDIEFVKLDYIIRLEGRFVELSIIYSLKRGDEFEESVKKDIDELYRERKYYKVLKRIFSLLTKSPKSIERDRKLVLLTNFFNSEVGRKYQDASNLRAIKLLLENYGDEDTRNKAELNLRNLKMELGDITGLERFYNKEAKKIIEEL